MASENQETYALLIKQETNPDNRRIDWAFNHINLRVVRIDHENSDGLSYGVPSVYDGFWITCQQDGHCCKTHTAADSYAWSAGYKDKSFGFYDLDEITKLLRRLQRGMEKQQEVYGYPSDYPAYVARVAHALGIKQIAWHTPKTTRQFYDRPYIISNVSAGVDRIRSMLHEWGMQWREQDKEAVSQD